MLMMPNVTEMVFVLDRSGSMEPLTHSTIKGFNTMINNQKKDDGEAYVTTVLFSDEPAIIHDHKPLCLVPEMTENEYSPRGCTALLDAIGETIRLVERREEENGTRKVFFVITTDGLENASVKYSSREIREMVERNKAKGWEFVFLGANIDSFAVASSFGISKDNTADYIADSEGTAVFYNSLCCAISDIRENGSLRKEWKRSLEEEKKRRR